MSVWNDILWHVIVIKFKDFRNAHPLYDKKIVMLLWLLHLGLEFSFAIENEFYNLWRQYVNLDFFVLSKVH